MATRGEAPHRGMALDKGKHSEYEQACDSALRWIVRLRSPEVSARDRESFALWLAASPMHRQAMDRMQDMWDDLGCLEQMQPQEAEAANAPQWWQAGIAAAACLVLALFLWPLLVSDEVTTLEYRTAMGERSDVSLPDGSAVALNTSTLLRVTYSDDQRLLELARGEAWFQVAHDADRPFHVDAGAARVTALGTAFNIELEEDGTSITVTEGVVRVTERGATGARAPATGVLRANEHMRADARGLQAASRADTEAALAWQRGEIVARGMTLAELLDELARYGDTRIMIGDPALGLLTVSGVFQPDQPKVVVNALEVALDLQAVRLPDGSIRLLKADQ